MTSLPAFSLDTPPTERITAHSGHNFREVAPELLSPFSWSIIGAGMELGFRRAAVRFGREKPTGPRPHFVSYFGFRPFFNMTSIERLATELPVVDSDDIWELLLGGPGPGSGKEKRRAAPHRLGWLRGGLAFVGGNAHAFGRAHAELAAAESAVLHALHSGGSWQAGSACDAAIRAGRTAWELHIRTTSVALIAASVTRQLLASQFGREDALRLLRASAQRKHGRGGASARNGVLAEDLHRLNNYEVTDGDGPFGRHDHFTASAAGGDGGHDRGGGTSATSAGEIGVPLGTALGPVHERMMKILGLALGERERSKEIGLQALHCTRVLLDRGMFGFGPAEAALLGADELRVLDARGRKRLADERAAELQEAAATDYPPDVLLHNGLTELRRSAHQATNVGRALAPGWAEGELVRRSDGEPGRILTGSRVDGNYVLATLPDGVVSKYGSVLSHVAIVCRELGIPLIAGVSVDPSDLGQRAVVDGWTGMITAGARRALGEARHGA